MLILFTGAGIGVPLGLPTTTGFKNTIRKIRTSKSDPFFEVLGADQNDIEKVLYAFQDFVDPDNLTYSIINKILLEKDVLRFSDKLLIDKFTEFKKSIIEDIDRTRTSTLQKILTIKKDIGTVNYFV